MQITTRDTIRDYQRDLESRNRSERTIQSYTEALEQLDAHHDGAMDILAMRKPHVRAYIAETIKVHSAATAQVRFRSLRAFYNWAVKEEYIEKSPMATMELPEADEKPIPIPPIEDLQLIIKTAATDRSYDGRRDVAMVKLFCESGGPRIGEMARLRVADLDMRYDQVTVTGKGRRTRVFPFAPTTGRVLSRFLRERSRHPLADLPGLWLGKRGQALGTSGIYQMVERRCAEVGVERIHPHQFRHYAVHMHFLNGGTEQDAMRLFGWISPDMARRYAAAAGTQRAIKLANDRRIGDLLGV
jgi:site-specific recombinase XerD